MRDTSTPNATARSLARHHTFVGTTGNDHLSGRGGDDTFDLSAGGEDYASGGKGNDTFLLGGTLSGGDRIIGGAGLHDTLVLDATTYFTFGATTLSGIEWVRLGAGGEYDLHFAPAAIPKKGLHIDASALGDHDNASISVTGSTVRSLFITGGHSEDILTGSDGNDVIDAGEGNDTVTGGGGADLLIGGVEADCYHYHAASDSTGLQHDTVRGFNESDGDMIVVPFLFGRVNPAVTVGQLNGATFDADLGAALNSDVQLGVHDAVLFTPDSGDMAGKVFLAIDFDGQPGYQAGVDVVILMDGAVGLDQFNDSAFISDI